MAPILPSWFHDHDTLRLKPSIPQLRPSSSPTCLCKWPLSYTMPSSGTTVSDQVESHLPGFYPHQTQLRSSNPIQKLTSNSSRLRNPKKISRTQIPQHNHNRAPTLGQSRPPLLQVRTRHRNNRPLRRAREIPHSDPHPLRRFTS